MGRSVTLGWVSAFLPARSTAAAALAGNTQALPPFPQALAADAQALGDFRLRHRVLMLEDETDEVLLQ